MNEINKREKFATQVDAAIIAELKSLAQAEGRAGAGRDGPRSPRATRWFCTLPVGSRQPA